MNSPAIISRVRRVNPWHGAAAAAACALFLFLAVRAVDQDRWSDWGFGDAQTLLSLRQWNESGWIANRLLFIPQGYAEAVRHLDDPDLRQHAHGTCPGASPRVGPRLWYTHYPAGYLVPYAALFRIGLDSMPAARLLSVLFSVSALALLYVMVSRLVSPAVAFGTAAWYALAPVFLGYADSLANQPIDDLLRFGFMLAVVAATRGTTERARRAASVAAWLIEFALSLSSFDSVFFLFLWLIGWDLLEHRRLSWKRYAAFALAPISAHGLQFLQNVWYLGLADAATDIRDTFLLKSGAAEESRLGATWLSIKLLFSNAFWPPGLLGAFVGSYALRRLLLRDSGDPPLPSLRLLGLLLACGLAYAVVLPHGARMPYQGRQLLPFVSLAAAGFVASIAASFRRAVTEPARPRGRHGWLAMPWLLGSTVILLVAGIYFAAASRAPTYRLEDFGADVVLAKSLRTFPAAKEPIFFNIDGFQSYWDPNYVPGYPQIMPLLEYYAGSRPILCFTGEAGLARDLETLLRRSPGTFSPILVGRDPVRLHNLVKGLYIRGTLKGMPLGTYPAFGRYLVDLTPFLEHPSALPADS